MIKLVTGNLSEAIQKLKPAVLLNVSDTAGTAAHAMCGILYRDYPCYTDMLSKARYSKPSVSLLGRYLYTNIDEVTHVLAFVDSQPKHIDPLVTYIGMDRSRNPTLINVLTSVNTDMLASGKKSILLPYYGKPCTGFSFTEFVELCELIFDPEITVMIAVSHQFAQYGQMNNMTVEMFNGPISHTGKRTIYATSQSSAPAPTNPSNPYRSTGWIKPQACA